MSVQVAGSPRCCGPSKIVCTNGPLNTWTHNFQGTGGIIGEVPLGNGEIALISNNGGLTQVYDSTRHQIKGSQDFCFETTIQHLGSLGEPVYAGLTTPDQNTGSVIITGGTTGWALSWSHGNVTTHPLLTGIPASGKHTFKVCRIGKTITVSSSAVSTVFEYAIDLNFPRIPLNPSGLAGLLGLSTTLNIFSFCSYQVADIRNC